MYLHSYRKSVHCSRHAASLTSVLLHIECRYGLSYELVNSCVDLAAIVYAACSYKGAKVGQMSISKRQLFAESSAKYVSFIFSTYDRQQYNYRVVQKSHL